MAAHQDTADGLHGGLHGALGAVLFDMDGVVTDTAAAHMAAWKAVFDAFLRERDPDAQPFTTQDYLSHVDGKPRLDGVRGFLTARGIDLPEGTPDDPPGSPSLHGLARAKNRRFRDWLDSNAPEVLEGTRALLDDLDAAGLPAAVFTASRNGRAVMDGTGLIPRFAAMVDGEDLAAAGLPGKPDPAMLLRAAAALGVAPQRAAVIEDSVAGIQAARAAGFAQAVGIDRDGAGLLAKAGAEPVVADPAELMLAPGPRLAARRLSALPHVDAARDDLAARLQGRRLAVFLDYDGTLTPIVARPEDATLSDDMRHALQSLAARLPVAIVSGRDLADVQALVGEDGLHYAGSHGFDLAGPGGWRHTVEAGAAFRPALAAAAEALETALTPFDGARVERKRFALAVHFRAVDPAREAELADTVRSTLTDHPDLRLSAGKKVFDIKPRVDWHKGRALLALLEKLDLDGADVLPLHIGDDTTDEDAFRLLAHHGLGVVVRDGSDRPTAARLALDAPAEVAPFLHWLAARAA